MTRARIGGKIDLAALHVLADSDLTPTGQAWSEALRLFHEGRRAQEIAAALHLPESLVQAWIAGATA